MDCDPGGPGWKLLSVGDPDGVKQIYSHRLHAVLGGAYDRQPRTKARVAERAAAAVVDPVMDLAGLWDIIAPTALCLGCAMAGTIVIGGAVANHIRVTLEIGPKGKKVVAVAPDWHGLERGATTGEAAIERLLSYVPRYATVTELAGMEAAFATKPIADVVERYPGTGSTDFWGVSFAFSSIDQQVMSGEAMERELTLMRACWVFFDDVRSRVSAELQRGPRGGGRDRDHIVRHTFAAELDWAKKLGVLTPLDAMLTDEGLNAHRDSYCNAIRSLHAQSKMARTWPLRYLIRHTAYHTLDHAWEMEDKDLTDKLLI